MNCADCGKCSPFPQAAYLLTEHIVSLTPRSIWLPQHAHIWQPLHAHWSTGAGAKHPSLHICKTSASSEFRAPTRSPRGVGGAAVEVELECRRQKEAESRK